ncbi:MAG: DUF448 domain-containing protein [Kordiimonadaceae bacterium]|nr:DUF448 domain-containing protein [Kordiimonadaceae bacterium]MBT6032436.1 DUF448 domain-containing protein [Kordiimonadaceae bacterium]
MTKEVRTRKCLVTKEVYPSSELLRFVCAPDGSIVPDVAAKLPGRGCWVYAKRDILEEAIKKKIFLRFGHQVQGNLVKKSKDIEELKENESANKETISVTVADDLLDLIVELLRKRCLDYVGLANRSGILIPGFEKVRSILKNGKTNVLLTACDGAKNGRSKVCQGFDNLKVIDSFTREELSQASGLENAVHLALLPGGIRTSLLREISRYEQCRKTVIK